MSILSGNVNMAPKRRALGMTLIELMIAMTLGLLVSIGIMSAFNATSKSNKIQASMARVQENGRYAMVRIERDLRMYGALFRSTTEQLAPDPSLSNPAAPPAPPGGGGLDAASATLFPKTSVIINTLKPFSYSDAAAAGAPGMESWPPPVTANNPKALSYRFMGQGYDCTQSSCTPTVPQSTSLPATGMSDGMRLPGTDVVTVRYLRGTGWTYDWTGPTTLQLRPYNAGANAQQRYEAGADDPFTAATTESFAMISDCAGAQIVSYTGGAAAIQLTQVADFNFLGTSGGGGSLAARRNNVTASRAGCDNRFFRIPEDLVTVTYWIKLIKDPNPDAPASRLIPVLMRNENGVSEELAQGVERLDFLYAVTDVSGNVSYLTATQIGAAGAQCPPPSADLYTPGSVPVQEAGCMWRAVRGIEVHALFSTVNDMSLTSADMAYRYSIDGGSTPVAPPATSAATGLPSGRMMRREFVTYVSLRNNNF